MGLRNERRNVEKSSFATKNPRDDRLHNRKVWCERALKTNQKLFRTDEVVYFWFSERKSYTIIIIIIIFFNFVI